MYKKSVLFFFFLFMAMIVRPSYSTATVLLSSSSTYGVSGYFSSNSNTSGISMPTSSETGLSDESIADILKNILNWMLGIVGVVAIISFVISGVQYMTSGGNEKSMEVGKRNMTYSIIGVLIVLGSFVIIQAIDTMLEGAGTF